MEVTKIKSGAKTTEFWVALATSGFGILVTLGMFTADQAADIVTSVQQFSGAIITAISAASYGISRGMAKKDVPPTITTDVITEVTEG